jgi:2-polyprenyl-3-methyl-5-hydroxy-6-metoxy-1,4-benzoquinol methylase
MTTYRDRIYRHYLDSWDVARAPTSVAGFAPRRATLRDLVARRFPADRSARILDLGCGCGALVHFAREAGYLNVKGIDISPPQVDAAARLCITGIEQGDLYSYLAHTPTSSVDVVIAFDVIEHFTKDELVAFVDDVFRVLSPQGRWIIHAPNAESPFGGAVRYGDFAHEQAFTRTSLEQLLRASGFSKVDAFESSPVPHGVTSCVRAALWQLVRITYRIIGAVETGTLAPHAIYSRNLYTIAYR